MSARSIVEEHDAPSQREPAKEGNPWAQIDQLKRQHEARIRAAVAALEAAGFKGNVRGRLEWDGTFWSFPVSGRKQERRSLEELVKWCVELKTPLAVAVTQHVAGGKP